MASSRTLTLHVWSPTLKSQHHKGKKIALVVELSLNSLIGGVKSQEESSYQAVQLIKE